MRYFISSFSRFNKVVLRVIFFKMKFLQVIFVIISFALFCDARSILNKSSSSSSEAQPTMFSWPQQQMPSENNMAMKKNDMMHMQMQNMMNQQARDMMAQNRQMMMTMKQQQQMMKNMNQIQDAKMPMSNFELAIMSQNNEIGNKINS